MAENTKKHLKTIRNQYFSILGKQEKKNLPLSIKEEWLLDNYYIIAQYAQQALQEKKHTKFSSTKLETILCPLLQENNYWLQYDNLENCLLQHPLEEEELFALNRTLVFLLLQKMQDFDVISAEEFGNCIKTLRFIGTYSFDTLYQKISHLEHFLSQDPTGVYPQGDRFTKQMYRDEIVAYAKKHRITQMEAAKKMGYLACTAGIEKNRMTQRLYFWSIATLTILLVFLSVWFAGFCTILLLLPLYELAKQICESIYSKKIAPSRLPKLKLEEIPENAKTLVVLTSLLFGEGKDDFLFEKLEDFYLSNRDKNIHFGILGDFKDSAERITSADEAILEYACRRIRALNAKYAGMFCLLIRHRSFCSSEKRFMGWERKRGAVLELTRFIKKEETSIATFEGDLSFVQNTKYVVTLDADTNLYLGAVKEMLGAMLHPLNQPILKENRVVKGYGVLQPRMATSLVSASKTWFSILLSGNGGMDIYSSAAFDLYQTIFGEGIFCGKGIFSVDTFYQVLDNAFPEESVLSHDLLEGIRLRAAVLTDIELTDSCPKNAISYFDRMHRWMRGDMQALAFVGKTVRNADNNQVKNPATPLSKWKIIDNFRRILTPIFAVLALIIALFFEKKVVLSVGVLALFYLILPSLIRFLSLRNLTRKFFSTVIPGIWHTFLNMLYQLSSLFHVAYLSLDAVVRSFIRMHITHRHMLEWVTANENDTKKATGIWLYLKKMGLSVLAGIAFVVFVPYGYYKVLGFLWMLLPFASFWLAREDKSKHIFSIHQKEELEQYVRAMWQYYADFAGEADNYLPPDNYQISPQESVAHRTSPTNIGVYLLSCLAARDFGILTSTELYERLTKSCNSLLELSKWHGHLYNWYHTQTLELIGFPYVSTVDSGNFVTSLIALQEGIKEYIGEEIRLVEIVTVLDTLIKNTDFGKLYHSGRDLFYLGYDMVSETYSENCYDLYMSEARTTSYYAVASGAVPKEHWAKLGRTLISKDGYLGLASWTGTAFEYFMPPLLLPVYKNSLSYEALRFAYKMQKEAEYYASYGVSAYGISESGFFAFDAAMNYQYKAFGVQKLGLKRGLNRDTVIAPYSSFLMLAVGKESLFGNFAHLKKLGAYGKYGFYEAVDFTHSRVGNGNAIIRSYMAHHLGMSIIAATNACWDNCFQKRFLKNPQMASARELLQEKIPVDDILYRDKSTGKQNPPVKSNGYPAKDHITTSMEANLLAPRTALVSNNKSKIIASTSGHIFLSDGKYALTNPSFEKFHTKKSLQVWFQADDTVYGTISNEFTYFPHSMEYRMKTDTLQATTTYTVYGEQSCYAIHFAAEGKFQTIVPMLFFEPVLMNADDYAAHPAFSNLSVEAEYDQENHLLLFKRRPRLEKESEKWLAIALASDEFVFETRREDALPLLYRQDDIKNLLKKPFTNHTGACITPVCAIKRKEGYTDAETGKYAATFLLSFAKSRMEVIQILKNVQSLCPDKQYMPFFKKSLYEIIHNQMIVAGITKEEIRYGELVLSCMHYRLNHTMTLQTPLSQKKFWEYGISGDLPLICLNLEKVNLDVNEVGKIVGKFIRTQKYLLIKGIRFDLVVLYEDTEQYTMPIKQQLENMVQLCGSEYLLSHKGGIFLLNKKEWEEDVLHLFESFACLSIKLHEFSTFDTIYHDYMDKEKIISATIEPITTIQSPLSPTSLTAQKGGFTNQGFTIIKRDSPVAEPWSYIYTNRQFGTLVTQNSLGFTWCENAREKRITPWSNDALLDNQGERLLLTLDEITYDLCAVSNKVEFRYGEAVYTGCIQNLFYTIRVSVDEKLYCKWVAVEWYNRRNTEVTGNLEYKIVPIMGVSEKTAHFVVSTIKADTEFFQNNYTTDFSNRVGFLKKVEPLEANWTIKPNQRRKTGYLLGVCNAQNRRAYLYTCKQYPTVEKMKPYSDAFFRKIQIQTQQPELDAMFNYYLPYQALYIRMYARTGFYQSSGAYGFRDQLQDSLAVLYLDSSITRTHILRCAAHQFLEGDVQHWWHTLTTGATEGHRGVRTRCSDDYLWLPFVVAAYVENTGDFALLDVPIAYIASPILEENEKERYETPQKSTIKESVYLHCIRAIAHSFRFGVHGIPLIGTCDWNDGMSKVGEDGKGESVWLAWFLVLVLKRFLPVCQQRNDKESIEKYKQKIRELLDQIEKNCYDGKWYLRGFYDDGRKLGSQENEECKIDVLPQAFSAIAQMDGHEPKMPERIKSALDSAYQYLYDDEFKLCRLFTPPFVDTWQNPGYIKGYVAGIRENGGQYSHAAVWGAYGFLAFGENERGYRILEAINPAFHCKNPKLAEIYRNEPYFFSGDVYTNSDHYGRGGWSLYTGAAAWYYKVVLEELLGYREYETYFTLQPRLSKDFPEFTISIHRKETKYKIHLSIGKETTHYEHFLFDKGEHFIEIYQGNS